MTEYRIPSVLSREQCIGKFHRGCPGPSLLPIFYSCLESIALPLMPGSPPVRKLGVFPGKDDGMLDWAVECAQLAGELVHGEASRCLFFPGTDYGEALEAVMDAARKGRPIVLHGFDLSALEWIDQHEDLMKRKNLPFSVATDMSQQNEPSPEAFAYHLLSIIEIADGDRENLTLQCKEGEISLTRDEVRPGFHVAAAFEG